MNVYYLMEGIKENLLPFVKERCDERNAAIRDLAEAIREHGRTPQRIVHVEQRGGPHADHRPTLPAARQR